MEATQERGKADRRLRRCLATARFLSGASSIVIISVLWIRMFVGRPDCLSLTIFNKKGASEPLFAKKVIFFYVSGENNMAMGWSVFRAVYMGLLGRA
jgi:hypothetical protein